MNFDDDRQGSGTAEWAEKCLNISVGCSHNCIYCYARANSVRFGLRAKDDWEREELTKKAFMTSYPKHEGAPVVMMPSSHDITPAIVEPFIRVAKLVLGKGNRMLIVSKPHLDCIDRVTTELAEWKELILFRFTIGSMKEAVTDLWEPEAPKPEERIAALSLALERGYRTSVSIEPMLEGCDGAIAVVEAVRSLISDTVWIGKMNKARSRVDGEYALAVSIMENLQRDEEIMRLYHHFKADPIIRWKDSIKEVVGRLLP